MHKRDKTITFKGKGSLFIPRNIIRSEYPERNGDNDNDSNNEKNYNVILIGSNGVESYAEDNYIPREYATNLKLDIKDLSNYENIIQRAYDKEFYIEDIFEGDIQKFAYLIKELVRKTNELDEDGFVLNLDLKREYYSKVPTFEGMVSGNNDTQILGEYDGISDYYSAVSSIEYRRDYEGYFCF